MTDINRRDDLVEWLRDWLTVCSDGEIVVEPICEEIANHIEALQGEVDRLREAVGEIKEAWDWWNVDTYDRCASVVDDAIRAALGEKL